jgi:ubiquinone/menaquinone biosynthesis C-methylase UbiE
MTTLAMPKAHGDRGMEGMVARWYAVNTGEMINEYVELARGVASELPSGSRVLEVAPGPGYFCIELSKMGSYSITGLDISHTFVKMAAEKAAKAGVKVEFKQGSASKMPLPSDQFDFLLCRAAFKNFGDPVGALREMCRVLKPGGRGLIIDLRRDASPALIDHHVDKMSLSTVNKFLTRLAFKTTLLRSAYTREEFLQMLGQTEFSGKEVNAEDIGLEIRLTK